MKFSDKELAKILQWFELVSDMLGDDDLKIYDKINDYLEGTVDDSEEDSEDMDDYYYYDEED